MQKVWEVFGLESLKDLVYLYIAYDVLLLDSVLQQYRTECINSYDLDPVHYYTAPGLTWDAGLKYTEVELELLDDQEMYTFIEQAIRGGISTITHRYAKANNHNLPDYDPSKPESYLSYIDANNLYGWAMCQKLPISGFKWQKPGKLLTVDDIMAWDPNGDVAYFVECDTDMKPEDHDKFNDLPLFPDSLVVQDSMVSNATRKAMDRRGVNSVAPSKKLAPNLFPKIKHKIHVTALQYYISIGGFCTKIHRVIEFKQSDWLRKYIEFNTQKRQESTSEFGKAFFKLLNNAFFGKSMESVRLRVNIRLIRNGRHHRFQTSKPGFKRFCIFSDKLVGLELVKPVIVLDKPIYLGAAILDLSKLLIFRFWYDILKVKYSNI